jgi:hypothetical protein
MSTEAYIEMCEIMGDEVDPNMLVSLEDFPEPILAATEIYNYLPDMYISGMDGAIFLGKDITGSISLLNVKGVVDNDELELALWALKTMNERVRKKSFAKAANRAKT